MSHQRVKLKESTPAPHSKFSQNKQAALGADLKPGRNVVFVTIDGKKVVLCSLYEKTCEQVSLSNIFPSQQEIVCFSSSTYNLCPLICCVIPSLFFSPCNIHVSSFHQYQSLLKQKYIIS